MLDPRRELAKRARKSRLVVKIGSSVLTDRSGRLAPKVVRRIAGEGGELVSKRRWVYVVSSGAIAVGIGVLGLKSRPRTIPGLQAAAAVGQSKLVEAWSSGFRRFDIPVAQVLLTHSDLGSRERFLNTRRALAELERRGALAIINENDTVSFEEIALGDNDGLAAQVSNVVDAGVLLLLSVAPGILDADGEIIQEAVATDPRLDAVVRPVRSAHGSGGMASKIEAARIAAARGAHVLILDGTKPDMVAAALAGERVGTLLSPEPGTEALNSRHHWILHSLRPVGAVLVDDGAVTALVERKKSLLPSGILKIEGDFSEGAPIDVIHKDGKKRRTVARGLARYSSAELHEIAGFPSSEIRHRLGFSLGDAAIHRDDLVVI